ncbi:hypothetical protein VTO42DRAFT_4260 [Malbranchea cinnamomea]
MAAPDDSSMRDLSGKWQMDYDLSDDWAAVFELQNISWLVRKAIALATVTLDIKQYTDDDGVVHIDIDQILTGGINGSQEKRTADWNERHHTDHIFGHVIGQSRLIKAKPDGKGSHFRPDLEVQTNVGVPEEDELVGKFLRSEILKDGTETEGFVAGADDVFLQSWVRSVDNGWTAEQIWGFENVNGERRHTRRVVVAKEGQVQKVRLVYKYLWEMDEEE